MLSVIIGPENWEDVEERFAALVSHDPPGIFPTGAEIKSYNYAFRGTRLSMVYDPPVRVMPGDDVRLDPPTGTLFINGVPHPGKEDVEDASLGNQSED